MTRAAALLAVACACWTSAPAAREVEFVYVRESRAHPDCPGLTTLVRHVMGEPEPTETCGSQGHGTNFWWCRWQHAAHLATKYRDLLHEITQTCGGWQP